MDVKERERGEVKNPGDKTDEIFNKIVENYDKTSNASDELRKQEEGERPEENNSDNPTDDLNEREQNGSGFTNNFTGREQRPRRNFRQFLTKKNVAIAGAGGGLFASLGLLFAGPLGIPIVYMKEGVTNYHSLSARLANARAQRIMDKKLDNPKAEEACTNKPKSLKCRAGTMSEKEAKRLKKQGFNLNAKEIDVNGKKRYVVTSLAFPGETDQVKSGKDFMNKVRGNTEHASAARRGKNFMMNAVNGGQTQRGWRKSFNLVKGLIKLSGKNNKEAKADTNKAMGHAPDGKVSEERVKPAVEKTKGRFGKLGKVGKGNPATAVPGLVCAANSGSKLIEGVVRYQKVLQAVGFGIAFLKVADQIKAQKATPETVNPLLNQLTATPKDGSDKGKSALDSVALMAMISGTTGSLKPDSLKKLYGQDGMLGKVRDFRLEANNLLGGEKQVKTLCNNFNKLSGAIGAVSCLTAGPVTLVACVGGALASEFLLPPLLEKVAQEVLLPVLIDVLAKNTLNADSIGPDVGDGIALGASALMSVPSKQQGMKPATSFDQVEKTVAMTAETDRINKQIDIAEAKKTPFDVYNKYSVTGLVYYAVMDKTNLDMMSRAPALALFDALRKTTIPGQPALAYATMELPVKRQDLENCVDTSLKEIGALCNNLGEPFMVASTNKVTVEGKQYDQTDVPIDAVLKYMEQDNKFANEDDATPIDGTPYKDYVENCAERSDPFGVTDLAPDDDKYQWGAGIKCSEENEQMFYFQRYYAHINETVNGDQTEGEEVDEQKKTDTANGGQSSGENMTKAEGNWGGFSNGKIPEDKLSKIAFTPNHFLRTDAARALEQLNEEYKKKFGKDISITDSYRNFAEQVDVKKRKPTLAAVPGTSNHGWGLALDLGGGIEDGESTPEHIWMEENAPKFGWIHPAWAKPGGSKLEPWHWEYARKYNPGGA